MHTLHVNNFGPLHQVDLEVTSMIFVLGEQASGKSTLAKLIYFFRSVKNLLIENINEPGYESWKDVRKAIVSSAKNRFTQIFGSTNMLGQFMVKYEYSSRENTITISPSQDGRFLNLTLSQNIINELRICWDVLNNNKNNPEEYSKNQPYFNKIRTSTVNAYILDRMNEILDDDLYSIYVPAGRALLSLRNSILQLVTNYELNRGILNNNKSYEVADLTMRSFMEEVEYARNRLLFPAQVDESLISNSKYFKYFDELSRSVLKSSYTPTKYGDFLKLDSEKSINLANASSGQQEIVWLLNILKVLSMDTRKCLLFIEEPEAHLHPDAQYLVLKLVFAFCNYTKSHVILTTHSPYILSSINNLLYAHKVSDTLISASEVNNIIDSKSWIQPEGTKAYFLQNGVNIDIFDSELSMIDMTLLDKVAACQDSEYDSMVKILKGR